MNINELASIIAYNNAGEQEAISGYYDLIKTPGLPKEFYDDIYEIISDEMNHAIRLSHWVTKLTGVEPAKD